MKNSKLPNNVLRVVEEDLEVAVEASVDVEVLGVAVSISFEPESAVRITNYVSLICSQRINVDFSISDQ
jgi:hypothetical protein